MAISSSSSPPPHHTEQGHLDNRGSTWPSSFRRYGLFQTICGRNLRWPSPLSAQGLPSWGVADHIPVLQEGGPLPGSESGPSEMYCLRRHMWWQSKSFYWEGVESSRLLESRGLLCHISHSLTFFGDGVSFRVVSGQSFWLRVLPVGMCIFQPRWSPEQGFLGGLAGHIISPPSSFWPLPDSAGLVLVIQWTGMSSLLLDPPKFSQFVFGESTTFFVGTSVLLWDNSDKRLSCLAQVGDFFSPTVL